MSVTASREQSGSFRLRTEDIPFSAIPGQSKLFLDYLKDPTQFPNYYSSAVSSVDSLTAAIPDVLAEYVVDRTAICKILERQNTECGSGKATFENIRKLGESDCVAVLTGQQAGLFTGPLYTIYKALSAVKAANELTEKGTPAVPIFWIASEDHDFEEVAKTFSIANDGELFGSTYSAVEVELGLSVGSIAFDSSLEKIIDDLIGELRQTEFTSELRQLLRSTYQNGSTFSTAFGKMLAKLFESQGLIIFDPMDADAKRLATTIVTAAIEKSDLIVKSLIARSADLRAAGYHAQVLVQDDYFPLFWFDEGGIRRSLKKINTGKYRASGTKREFETSELLTISESSPKTFSAGVMFRPVVQDFLFPTVCYFGGGAEIAYFAQNSEVYRVLGRRQPAILHRQSFTLVDPKQSRSLDRFDVKFEDLFQGLDKMLPRIVDEIIDPKTPTVFADVEERINMELNRIDQLLAPFDPTLAESLAKRRRKIIYHIGALRDKARRSSLRRDDTINRQLRSLFSSLYPRDGLQERTFGIASFFNSYGPNVIALIYESIEMDNRDHRLLYL
ncbi:MAG: bacillithiol biosynthesis cysteine-adding enzyme BshC [Pyrinomonadaceae bacterium]